MNTQTITTVTPPAPALLNRIRGEFREMPGLTLTLCQAQRMWNLRRSECERLLDDLVASGFLTCSPLGVFMRADTGRRSA